MIILYIMTFIDIRAVTGNRKKKIVRGAELL